MNILSVGNSFSQDTMALVPKILPSLGISQFRISNLYIGGCSLNRHYNNAMNDTPGYTLYTNTGEGWTATENVAIAATIRETHWDIISIQHGTGDKSRYTAPESYEKLLPLIAYVRALAPADTRIAFNMAWVADPESPHHEISSYGGDQAQMFQNLIALTRDLIAPLKELDILSPAGTAIQNARPYISRRLTRDYFHLSLDLGRYIAALTFLKALLGLPIEQVTWRPESVTEQEQDVAIKAACRAVENPFAISSL